MMRHILIATPLLATLLGVTACGPRDGLPPPEAGQGPATFGLAVRSNQLVSRGLNPLVSLQDRFRTEAPTMVTFPFGSAALDATAQAILDRQAGWMRRFPEVRFSVIGHTDAVGSAASNEALGRRRAEVVLAYLAARGVSPARLNALVSFGERRPVVPGRGPEQANRRAITHVAGFVRSHPTVLNGDYAAIVFREYEASAVPISPLQSESAFGPGGGGGG